MEPAPNAEVIISLTTIILADTDTNVIIVVTNGMNG